MIREFFQKAKENLKAAQVLFDQKLYNASVTRSYYSAFQIAIAALAKYGITSDKIEHSRVQANFNGELIHKRKIFSGHFKSYLPDLQAVRNRADYKTELLSQKTALRQLTKTKEFVTSVEKEFASYDKP
jgi:uncharacterized protein (UPF0332 family)